MSEQKAYSHVVVAAMLSNFFLTKVENIHPFDAQGENCLKKDSALEVANLEAGNSPCSVDR